MKNKKTYYLLVLDKSGSMQSCENETISGFNEQVQMIRNLQKRFTEQEFYVSLTTFSDEVEHVFDKNTGTDIRELTKSLYVPNGSTALLDAIGESVMKLKSDIGHEIEKGEATAVVVIITDGEENASKLFPLERHSKNDSGTGKLPPPGHSAFLVLMKMQLLLRPA